MRPCLRCLLSEMPDQAGLMKTLRELISLIPEEDRTPDFLRERRLDACRRCGHLNAGTCGLCGCYVEHRAARRKAGCPDIPDRWAQGAGGFTGFHDMIGTVPRGSGAEEGPGESDRPRRGGPEEIRRSTKGKETQGS